MRLHSAKDGIWREKWNGLPEAQPQRRWEARMQPLFDEWGQTMGMTGTVDRHRTHGPALLLDPHIAGTSTLPDMKGSRRILQGTIGLRLER